MYAQNKTQLRTMEEMKKCMDGRINEKMGGKTETGLSSIHNYYYRQWNDQSSGPNVNTHIAWNRRELPARERTSERV